MSLAQTAKALAADDKGLLAMDESNATCNKRFAALGIAQTEESRRQWRELILSTPGLAQSISGVILYDETLFQTDRHGALFLDVIAAAGMIAGIKVDSGKVPLPNTDPPEAITEGLDGLAQRLASYRGMGLRFAKWRAVFSLGAGQPSPRAIAANAHALARYAALCQTAGLVPVVEPEVLMAGTHPLEACAQATEAVLRATFAQCYEQGVRLEEMVLKVNMVLPGLTCPVQPDPATIAEATLATLRRSVPSAVPAVLFLSGGQSAELASARLNAIHLAAGRQIPTPLSFSFARAIQQPALELWRGDDRQVAAAQAVLAHRAQCNRAARRGDYLAAMEHTS